MYSSFDKISETLLPKRKNIEYEIFEKIQDRIKFLYKYNFITCDENYLKFRE